MITAKTLFHSIIDHAKISMGVYDYLCDQKVPLDSSDLLRWQWVIAVSALDKYIHDIVRIGMVQEFMGTRARTTKFDGFKIDLANYSSFSNSLNPEIDFEREIIRQHGYQSFQRPDSIGDALGYIWSDPNKWDVISQNMPTPISTIDLKKKLNNIVVRRNQIAHEGDCYAPILPLQQTAISRSDVMDVISFITELVEAISLSVT